MEHLVHGTSYCSPVCEQSAINNFIHRLLSVPLSPAAFKNEKSIIRHLVAVNGLDVDVDNLIQRKQNRIALVATTSILRLIRNRRERWIRMPYLAAATSQLARILKPHGYRIASYSSNTMGSLFGRGKV